VKKPFAVLLTHGAAYLRGTPLEAQPDWTAHAAFMDALADEGFVVLGGPLETTDDVLLIVRAESPADIADRLAADPWHRQDLLRISRIAPWTIRLGSLEVKSRS
jgi:uncharacterized protein YciI